MIEILFTLVILALFALLGYNRISLKKKEALLRFSKVESQLETRNKELHALLGIAQKNIENQLPAFTRIANLLLRSSDRDLTINQKIDIENKMRHLLHYIFIQPEVFKELESGSGLRKSYEDYLQIIQALEESCQHYNEAAKEYNYSIHMFPSNVFALLFAFRGLKLFEIPTEKQALADLRSISAMKPQHQLEDEEEED
jgi:LemA protein